MFTSRWIVFAMVLIVGVSGCMLIRGDGKDASPSARYVDAILGALDHIEGNLASITESAEQAAARLVAGGHLYAAGGRAHEAGFASEACGRAGGMMMIQYAPRDPSTMKEGDVLLVGTVNLDPDEQREHLRAAREAGALVILFGSSESPSDDVDALIANGLPAGPAPVVTIDGRAEAICPAGPVANIAALWVFTGELIAACTRQGKMPTMWQSIFVPGSGDRNPRYQPHAFHEEIAVEPVPPEKLGRAYLAEIRRCFRGIRDHQIPALQEGGRKIAEVIRSGHTAWLVVVGHHLPSQLGMPGDPKVMDRSLATQGLSKILETVGPNDALAYVGYYDFPNMVGTDWQPLREMGVPSVLITGGRETKPLTPLPGEIHVDPYWTYGDACVEVPGYDVKILPPSGVMQTAALWMIVGEVANAM